MDDMKDVNEYINRLERQLGVERRLQEATVQLLRYKFVWLDQVQMPRSRRRKPTKKDLKHYRNLCRELRSAYDEALGTGVLTQESQERYEKAFAYFKEQNLL